MNLTFASFIFYILLRGFSASPNNLVLILRANEVQDSGKWMCIGSLISPFRIISDKKCASKYLFGMNWPVSDDKIINSVKQLFLEEETKNNLILYSKTPFKFDDLIMKSNRSYLVEDCDFYKSYNDGIIEDPYLEVICQSDVIGILPPRFLKDKIHFGKVANTIFFRHIFKNLKYFKKRIKRQMQTFSKIDTSTSLINTNKSNLSEESFSSTSIIKNQISLQKRSSSLKNSLNSTHLPVEYFDENFKIVDEKEKEIFDSIFKDKLTDDRKSLLTGNDKCTSPSHFGANLRRFSEIPYKDLNVEVNLEILEPLRVKNVHYSYHLDNVIDFGNEESTKYFPYPICETKRTIWLNNPDN